MSRACALFRVVVLVLSGAAVFSGATPVSAQVLFAEDWENGEVDEGKWQIFGSPSPFVVSSGFQSSYSFDPRGESDCDSGVQSRGEFELAGRRLSFVARVTDTRVAYVDAGVGFEDLRGRSQQL